LKNVVAGDHGALARAAHGQSVDQADPGEKSVHLAFLVAYDRERTVLGPEPPKRVEENVHPGRVHEGDLGQIHDDRAALVLENREQDLPQQRRGAQIDFTVDTEHRDVLMMLVRR
jgi:hypothetical protein